MPLHNYQTEEERTGAADFPARAYTTAIDLAGDQRPRVEGGASAGVRPRLFNLRAIAGRLLGRG
jgi:hypothetical protein